MNAANDGTPPGDQSRARIWLWFLLVYWLLLFTGTHLPPMSAGPTLSGSSDEIVHIAAYAGLAFLMARCWQSQRGKLSWGRLLVVWMTCVLFGAVDEVTQQFVGRESSVSDWVADACGAAVGVVLYCWTRPSLRRRSVSQSGPPNQ